MKTINTLALLVVLLPVASLAQVTPPVTNMVQINNPNWNITLTDSGYSDYLFDNTPGFEGREYLSGEWGAAVSYRKGSTVVTPTWLEPNFAFPDWKTNSNFTTVTPITVTGQAFGGLDSKAASTIANSDLRIDMSYEMVDTVVGKKMGLTKASTSGTSSIDTNRYVLKQTYTLTNTSGEDIQGLNLFQFLHGYHSVSSLYDNHTYTGPLAEFKYQTSQVAIDTTYATQYDANGNPIPGSTFKDYIGFAGKVAPVAYDNGRYGIEGVDDHATTGKPSVGVHLAIEADALANADSFAPAAPAPTNWVGGAQKYQMGTIANGQSISVEIVLGIRTGTVVSITGQCSGSANGGSKAKGGVDYSFESVTIPGAFYAEYDTLDADEIAEHIARGDFKGFTFATPGQFQLYELEYDGEFDGDLQLTFGYDPSAFPNGFDESQLKVFHYVHGGWENMGGSVDSLNHTVTITTSSLSPYTLGLVPEPGTLSIVLVGAGMLLMRRR